MARHRNVRKLKLEDELDEEEDVDWHEEEEPLSPESAQFIYQRPGFPIIQSHKPPAADDREAIFEQNDELDGSAVQSKQNVPAKSEKVPKNNASSKAKEKIPPIQPAVQNLRLSETPNVRSNSKSPSRTTGKPSVISNIEMAQNAAPNYKRKVNSKQPRLNLIIVGHVDAGKSTLVGHLLYLLGSVDERLMHKYRQESSRMGKASFAFAWILDESEEERNRGVTMDIARTSFESPSGRGFNVSDAPGHKDFIPNMISGASQADAALLVVNATRGEFETGFDQGGQTREHALLIRALGVSRVVVAVNKLDTVDWSQQRYDELCAILGNFLLRRAGFESAEFVPVSGLLGINLMDKPPKQHPLTEWHRGQTLTEALDALQMASRPYEQWLRLIVNDVLRYAPQTLMLSAKVESGHVEAAEKLWLMPEAIPVAVKAISSDDSSSLSATPSKGSSTEQVFFAGDLISITLVGSFEPDTVFPGHVICRGGEELVMPCRHFLAKIVTFDIRMPILKGTQAELFVHSLRVPCVISHLRVMHPGAKDMEKKNPRFLPRNVSALVEIRSETPIPVEPFARTKSLGRIALRANGETIAAGIVEKCIG